jgi:hypothetical protein
MAFNSILRVASVRKYSHTENSIPISLPFAVGTIKRYLRIAIAYVDTAELASFFRLSRSLR